MRNVRNDLESFFLEGWSDGRYLLWFASKLGFEVEAPKVKSGRGREMRGVMCGGKGRHFSDFSTLYAYVGQVFLLRLLSLIWF